ncbi:MAG: hypothetical protein HY512_01725 [Candidatus Aenigmarchaeota archaeon]|nr:hypothetical protein [Candidatus Aenigmarchaeota archaeon]
MSYGIFEVRSLEPERDVFGRVTQINKKIIQHCGRGGRSIYPTIEEAQREIDYMGSNGRDLSVVAVLPFKDGSCIPL